MITKTYKYKLRLNSAQEQRMLSWIGVCRMVYNLSLEIKINAWKTKNQSLSKFDLCKQLPELKKDYPWIKDVFSQSIEDAVHRMDRSYQNFFRGAGFPKFAKKGQYNSITFRQGVKITGENEMTIPKFGAVKFYRNRLPQSENILLATVTHLVDGFYISIVVKEPKPITAPIDPSNAVGLDMGVKYFFTLSNGLQMPNPQVLKTFESKLRIKQRSLARKKKGSANWKKEKIQLQKLHLKIARVRENFIHNQSHFITHNFDVISIEDLRIKNMTRSAKGTAEAPGKMVRQKSGLNRVLIDVALGEFTRQLEYKADWRGKKLIKVNPKNTSITCSKCGHKDKKNRKTQAKFECLECGHINNADVNAALNIAS